MGELQSEIVTRLAQTNALRQQLSQAETMLENQRSLNSHLREAAEANQRQIETELSRLNLGSELEFQTKLAALIFTINELTNEETSVKAELLRRIHALLCGVVEKSDFAAETQGSEQ